MIIRHSQGRYSFLASQPLEGLRPQRDPTRHEFTVPDLAAVSDQEPVVVLQDVHID